MKRLNWWYIAAFVALILAVVLALVGWTTESVEGQLFYWGYIGYSTAGLWLGIGVLIISLIMLVLWFVGGIFNSLARIKPPFGAGLLMLAAAVLLLIGSFPSLLVSLRHRDAISAGDHRYQLAFRLILDGENQFILYECDSFGVICNSRYISQSYGAENIDGTPTAGHLELSPDRAAVNIVVNDEIIRSHPLG